VIQRVDDGFGSGCMALDQKNALRHGCSPIITGRCIIRTCGAYRVMYGGAHRYPCRPQWIGVLSGASHSRSGGERLRDLQPRFPSVSLRGADRAADRGANQRNADPDGDREIQ
jgi:hypothetical protein